jgi:DNA phosphorothioation-dependent restriction protein DptH
MSQGLQELNGHELAAALEQALLPLLAEQIRARQPGHCMRISNLSTDLMGRLCSGLRAEVPESEVVLLWDGRAGSIPSEMTVTGTKLVELRNPLPDGTQRPPLLVFIPDDLRTSAEDSFGVATFEDLQIGDVYKQIVSELLNRLPNAIQNSVQEIVRRLTDKAWIYAESKAIARFLLTIEVNEFDPAVVGAALFEVGLVPDFELLSDPAKVIQRLDRNRDCVSTLTWSPKSERLRVLELELANRAFRNKLANFLVEVGLEDPHQWTRRIVLDRNLWEFAFNRWQFEDGGEDAGTIALEVTALELPTVEEDVEDPRLGDLLGQKILPVGKKGLRKFSVSFQTDPHPSKVPGLAKFAAQVISVEAGPVGLVRTKSVWKSKKAEATISFSRYTKVDWEEGWHFVRIVPLTDSGDLLPLVDASGQPIPWGGESEGAVGVYPHESDLFYVLPDDELDIAPVQRAKQRESSLVHAQLRLQFIALQDERDPDMIQPTAVEWAAKSNRSSSNTNFIEVKFGREGSVNIPVSDTLKVIEQKILSEPAGSVNWHLSIDAGVVGTSTSRLSTWPQDDPTQRFLQARSQYFEAVSQGQLHLITQAADFYQLQLLVSDYASTYQAALQHQIQVANQANGDAKKRALAALKTLLAVDTIAVTITDYRGRIREAALVSPTHPLRALWLATWAQVGKNWLKQAAQSADEFVVSTRDTLLRSMAPVSFPPVLTLGSSQVLTAIDNIHPLWTLYAPSKEDDPRGLISDICTAFSLDEPGIGGATIDGAYLAQRLKRYLVQHPYVRTLTINAFNPGQGAVLADMLLELQKAQPFADLNYDIRLFVPDPDAMGVGSALVNLLSPTSSTTAQEADNFSTPSKNHLYPKLSLAIRGAQEFQRSPDQHLAHISILFDVFPAEQVSAEPASNKEVTTPVHGLYQTFEVDYFEDDSTVRWNRKPKHGKALPCEDCGALSDLLSGLPATMSQATAAIATGRTGLDLRPVLALALDEDDRAMIVRVHEVSDWVITIDRNMGIEFYDHGQRKNRPDYLIDHSPEQASNLGHSLVITSRSTEELEAMVRPVLQKYGLPDSTSYAEAVLNQLRSLSGRLALKLISSPSQRAEVLGLALAHLYLEYQGVFSNQVVVPLDAHLELYRSLQKQSDELGDEVSFKRTDLALFDLNAASRIITCRLVEVKCYSQNQNFSQLNQLKEGIAQQIGQSEEIISYHFDAHRWPNDRPDRLVKTREFAQLLETYLNRGFRYQLIDPQANEEARFFIETLEAGYRLDFTRSALIFDLAKPGTEAPDEEAGIEFHRIGIDLIRELLEASASLAEPEEANLVSEAAAEVVVASTETTTERLRSKAASVPKLSSAAFLGNERDRSVSWEDLRTAKAVDSEPTSDLETTSEPINSAGNEEDPATSSHEEADVSAEPTSTEQDSLSYLKVVEEPPIPRAAEVETEPSAITSASGDAGPNYDVLLGVNGESPQYGILGEASGRKVAIDLNQTHTISLFGVQGGGKSYTLGTIAEMASLAISNINRLPEPLTTIIFHYSPTQDYKPEFTSMVEPNSDEAQIDSLRERYGAEPKALSDVVLLTPADKLDERREEYPSITVHPIKFAASELQASHWRFLMGAVGNQSTYMRQLNRIMKTHRNNLTVQAIRDGIDSSLLPDTLKGLAHQRLELASEYIDDTTHLGSLIQPGRLVIVDLRDEFIEKDEALGLFVVLLQLFADAEYEGRKFNKLVVFDEAHKYIESPDLLSGLIEVVREMRHKGTSIMVASQDPPSVPVSLIELSSQIILHKFNSPAWLKHIQKANAALDSLTPDRMSNLKPGEAYIWSNKANEDAFIKGAVKVKCRPRVTQHGGGTKTAVES